VRFESSAPNNKLQDVDYQSPIIGLKTVEAAQGLMIIRKKEGT
jgi:hypothetical protein